MLRRRKEKTLSGSPESRRAVAAEAAPPALAGASETPEIPEASISGVLKTLAGWAGRGPVPRDVLSGFEGGVTPATLLWAGARLGFDFTELPLAFGSIEDFEPPCLVVFADAGAVLIAGVDARGRLLIAGEAPAERLSLDEVKARRPSMIFRVRPAETGREEPAALPLAQAAFRHVIRHRRGPLLRLLVAAAAGNLLLLALPIFSMAVYDRVLPHLAMETLWAVAVGVSIALAADLGLRLVRLDLSDAVGAAASVHLQTVAFRKLLFSRSGAAPEKPGALSHALRELDHFCCAVPGALVAALIDLPFVLLLLLALAAVSPSVAAVAAAGAAVLVLVQTAAQLLSEKRSGPASDRAHRQTDLLAETVAALGTVKLLGLEPRLLARWERLADEHAFEAHRARYWSNFSNQIAVVGSQVITVAVMIASVREIAVSVMTVGALAASTIIVNRMVAPLAQIVLGFRRLLRAEAVLAPVRAVLAAPQEAAADTSPAAERPFAGHAELRAVSLRHPGASRPVLDQLDLSIAPGERVALIGRVGSGKSTILRLFARLQEPDSGSVAFDGVDAKLLDPRALRRRIGLLAQDAPLLDDTLHANLVMAHPDVPPESFDAVVDLTGVRDVVLRRPDGFATAVGPRGETLSGGERQAVALARTLMADPALLLLDEPTAAMDNAFEAQIIRGLREWLARPETGPRRTLVVATHRLAVLDLADRIVWIEGGRILADGPRAQVLARMAAK